MASGSARSSPGPAIRSIAGAGGGLGSGSESSAQLLTKVCISQLDHHPPMGQMVQTELAKSAWI